MQIDRVQNEKYAYAAHRHRHVTKRFHGSKTEVTLIFQPVLPRGGSINNLLASIVRKHVYRGTTRQQRLIEASLKVYETGHNVVPVYILYLYVYINMYIYLI